MKKLVTKKQLADIHPAFTVGRLDWLVRTRQIPIVKKERLIFFDLEAVDKWIEENSIYSTKETKI